jgi:two-component system, OmpR family, sensor histidine kinase KdpD
MPPETQRASADALLALTKKERGRLKIFLGAAPGVGKTYAMLTAARAEKEQGREAVVGLVESHGRRETEALLDGFEVIARKPTVYVNKILSEFDIDKALARKPRLLLLDELAHSNIPGSRHPKRWQDVEELLAAGVDVWTTLNIQHLEGLNDILQKITRVQVRETVPDHVFEEADDIVLVDLPTEELLKRLAEGKVYVPDMAERARKRFFKPENLTALRELALRRAAERVDADLVERMQAQAIEGPWAAGERILACIGPDADATMIVRAAKRLADVMDAPWVAVTVEGPGQQLSGAGRRHVDRAMQLAQTLGAETGTLTSGDVAGELLRFARFENVTQIVLGRSRGGFVTEVLRRSLPHELVRRADGIAVHVLTTRQGQREKKPRVEPPVTPRLALIPMLWSTAAVALAVAIGHALTEITTFPNISMIFLMAVVFSAVTFGTWPAVYASVLSFLAYNFFFIAPLFTFTVAKPHELFALLVFLIIAVITSTLAGRIREQGQLAVGRIRATRRLYEFTRKLSGVAGYDDIPKAAVAEIHSSLSRPAIVLLESDGDLDVSAAWPEGTTLEAGALSAARWALEKDEPAGAETATLPGVPWYFLPLRTARASLGVVGLGVERGESLDPEDRGLFETLAEQTAAALDRASLAREMVSARSAAETERVRNTLLASISHDFRTPLASILGSATSLIEYGDKLDRSARGEMLDHIKQDAEGLDDMVRNLLAMTRIDAGALEVRRDWVDLRETVQRVAGATRRRGAAQTIDVALPAELPLVRADPKLIEQAIGNALANAIAHTPKETHILIDGIATDDSVRIHVTDDGPGIPADALAGVFEKFVHGRAATGLADGGESTGLGLTIAKGIMEAHGGTIAVESPVANGHGTRTVFTFPRDEAAQ